MGKISRALGGAGEVNTLQVQIWGRKKKITVSSLVMPGDACALLQDDKRLCVAAEQGEAAAKAKATGSLLVCQRNLLWRCFQYTDSYQPQEARLSHQTQCQLERGITEEKLRNLTGHQEER